MYVSKVNIRNIRSITEATWSPPADMLAGWHVIIGDNGSGKSTFLRCIALGLLGADEASALRENWDDWLTRGKESATIEVHFSRPRGRTLRAPSRGISLTRQKDGTKKNEGSLAFYSASGERDEPPPTFSAGYGPFRRFSGGDEQAQRLFRSNPRLAAHLSLFGEGVALTEYQSWLRDLQFKRLEKREEGDLLGRIQSFVNQPGFLPHSSRLEQVTSDGVQFVDGEGHLLNAEQLSDGYRSVLSMTFELLRQLLAWYDADAVFDPDDPQCIIASGIVLIDEVDAHLHPTWQRQIGLWFRKHFPNVQFIVTTHSPLVCQAADVGTVFRLPQPGSGETGQMIAGQDLDRLLYGNVLDAYGTEAFGSDITRSDAGQKHLQRLADLNVKEMTKGLSERERKEQQRLRASMPTSAHILESDETGGQR